MSTAAERAAARAAWTTTVVRSDEERLLRRTEDVEECLRWPVRERVRLTWALSLEQYELAARNGGVLDDRTGQRTLGVDLERRLPRSAWVLARR